MEDKQSCATPTNELSLKMPLEEINMLNMIAFQVQLVLLFWPLLTEII